MQILQIIEIRSFLKFAILEKYHFYWFVHYEKFISGSAGISGFMGGQDAYDASVQPKPGELEKGLKAV